jgi:hypothetical protein
MVSLQGRHLAGALVGNRFPAGDILRRDFLIRIAR